MPQGENAFTIIEVMIGLAIIAVLGLTGAVSLRGVLTGFEARNTPRQVATVLHTARLKAVSRHTNHKVTFYAATSYRDLCKLDSVTRQPVTVTPPSYQIYRCSGTVGCDNPVCDGPAVLLPTTVKFRSDKPTTFPTNDEVIFTTTGAPVQSGAVYLTGGAKEQQQYRVAVALLTGRIKIWKGW